MSWNNSPTKDGFKYRPRLKVWQDGVNNEFNPEEFEARSYNWWLYCCKIKGKVVFNDYHYSTPTGYHQSHMRDLLKKLKIKIDVKVSTSCSLNNLDKALKGKYEDLFEAQIKMGNSKKPSSVKHYAQLVKDIEKEIKTFRELGARFSRENQKALKAEMVKSDELRRASMREEAKEARKQRKAALSILHPELTDMSEVELPFPQMDDLNAINEKELGG